MSYSTDRAKLLTDVLDRIATLKVHQLVGHRDNLAFWLDEIVGALDLMDGYPARFRRLKEAQVRWVRAHAVKISPFCPMCGGACEFGPQTPNPPTRVPSSQMEESGGALREAGRRVLLRMYRAHMLGRGDLLAAGDRLATGFEPDELEREEPPDGG